MVTDVNRVTITPTTTTNKLPTANNTSTQSKMAEKMLKTKQKCYGPTSPRVPWNNSSADSSVVLRCASLLLLIAFYSQLSHLLFVLLEKETHLTYYYTHKYNVKEGSVTKQYTHTQKHLPTHIQTKHSHADTAKVRDMPLERVPSTGRKTGSVRLAFD